MGKYFKKSMGTGEVAVMEVAEKGVKVKRAREAADAEEPVAVKKTRIGDEDEMKAPLALPAPPLPQLESNDTGLAIPENLVSPERPDHARAPYLSGNESSGRSKKCLKFVDLEENGLGFDIVPSKCDSDNAESGNTTPVREPIVNLVPPPLKPKTFNNYILKLARVNMPSNERIDDYFSSAEKRMTKEFSEKYNFDFENDKPLEGRWEWVKISQP